VYSLSEIFAMSSLPSLLLTMPTVHLFYAELAYPIATLKYFTIFKKLVSTSLSLCFSTFLANKVCRVKTYEYDQMLIMFVPITLNILRQSNRKVLVVESLLTLANFGIKFKKEEYSKDDLWPITKIAIAGVASAVLYHKLNQISFLACVFKTAKLFPKFISYIRS